MRVQPQPVRGSFVGLGGGSTVSLGRRSFSLRVSSFDQKVLLRPESSLCLPGRPFIGLRGPFVDLKGTSFGLRGPSFSLRGPSFDINGHCVGLKGSCIGLKCPCIGLRSAISARHRSPGLKWTVRLPEKALCWPVRLLVAPDVLGGSL